MNPAQTLILLPLCAALLLLTACANESRPYTEQTAQIDPAMNPPQLQPDGLTPNADGKVSLTDEQWRAILSTEEYRILRQSGTEYAETGRYLHNGKEDKGSYHCVGCGNYLYDAKHKFHSGCGWPSFNQEVAKGAITTHEDYSYRNILRVEMRCARCDGHLGHIFDDAPHQPTGLRHCVNGTALIFVPLGQDPNDVIAAHRQKHANQ